jgi:zinc-ribbon domain
VGELERECPRCGAPVAEGQEYCLECGARLPAQEGLVATLGSAWRRRLGWYPGDWIWPALLALAVAAGAGVVSAIWLADRSSSANETLVLTNPGPSRALPTQTPPEPTTSATPTAPTGTTSAARPAQPEKVVAWPAGKQGWTIVLDSVPTTNGRTGAVAEAKQALRLGLKPVGVLESAGFSSLHPGYFVVFTGIYDTEAEAQSHIIDAHRHGYRNPYPRPITP